MAFQMLSSRQIADNIKRVRKEKKISQKRLAEMIDKTERTIQNYEAGQTDFSMSIIKDIAIALARSSLPHSSAEARMVSSVL